MSFQPPRWSVDDLRQLRADYGRLPVSRLAARLGRSELSVRVRAHRLGLRRKPPWTRDQNELLRRLYGRLSCAELSRRVGHTAEAVKQQATRLGLGRAQRTWTASEVSYLEAHYARLTARQIGARLGFRAAAVWTKASKLGLRKREPISAEAESVLWELRAEPGVEAWFSREFGVGVPAVRRAMDRLHRQGGPNRSPGNVPHPRLGGKVGKVGSSN